MTGPAEGDREVNLYFITAENADCENLDLFVGATTPERAIELWRLHYDEGDGSVTGTAEKDLRIWALPTEIEVEGVRNWNTPGEVELAR